MTQYHQPRSDTYAASNGDHLEVIPLGSAINEMNRADTTESTVTNDQQQPQTMTPLQRRNIVFLVLGFSCVVAGLTLIVGTGPIVIQSIGGSAAIAPMSLACFFLGMSVVSCTVTHWCFENYGWKFGFWFGCVLTVLGSTTSCVGLWMSSTAIVLFSNVILGAGAGIGMYLRFASVDVLPQAFASKGVTWTLCGGCLAAFVGPEVAAAVTGAFGDGYLTFFGVFVVTICFAVAQAVFIGLVAFGKLSVNAPENEGKIGDDEMEIVTGKVKDDQTSNDTDTTLVSLLKRSDFLLPLFVSVLSWSIMAQPMSIFRVAMREVGFTDRQSLTVIEFHFLAMYSPGFISGWFIEKFGTLRSSQVAISTFLLGTAINLSTQANSNGTVSWFLGMVFLGIGWNFGYSGATVWVTKVYAAAPHFKSKVQAANESLTFFLSGILIFSTGYIYNAGGASIDGWRVLNYFILGLIAILICLVLLAMQHEKTHSSSGSSSKRESSFEDARTADRIIDITVLPEQSEELEL